MTLFATAAAGSRHQSVPNKKHGRQIALSATYAAERKGSVVPNAFGAAMPHSRHFFLLPSSPSPLYCSV